MLWGASSAAYQIEGGIKNNWSRWEQEMEFDSDHTCGMAVDHYHRFKEDIDILAQHGMNSYRFSIEWARVEPKKGEYNQEAIEHYRNVLLYLKEKNITPMVCLMHFTLPNWFEELGGWTRNENVKYFVRYAKQMFKEFSDVKLWLSMNEPIVYAFVSYMLGQWPPCKKSPILCKRVIHNLKDAHNQLYYFHCFTDVQVGFTKNLMYFRKIGCMLGFTEYYWNEYWFKHVSFDFVGINYYMPIDVTWKMVFTASTNIFDRRTDPKYSDMGWEIDPKGIYKMIEFVSKFNRPIYITENGIADKNDSKRCQFIQDHIEQVMKAKEDFDVRGYFHWALTDNFEWDHGKSPRFGLVEIDYSTMKRIPRKSIKVYQQIIRAFSIVQV